MKKQYRWLTAAALTTVVLLAGCGSKSSSDTNATPTKNTSKTVSFVKEAKSQGTYVWLEANDASVNKDSPITAIDTLVNGKLRSYQIFDNNIRLGKLSKMSDAATIKLAKAQDKKYATTGAEAEVRSWLKSKQNDEDYSAVGKENDFDENAQKAAAGISDIYFTYAQDYGSLYGIQQIKKVDQFYPEYSQEKNNSQDVSPSDLAIDSVKGGYNDNSDLNYGKAILKSIKKTAYRAPKAQTVKVKNITDASGNKIIQQNISYKHIDFFADGDVVAKNFYELTKTNQDKFKELVELKDIESEWEDAKASIKDDPESNANPGQYVTAVKARKTLYDALIKPNYSRLVKGVYGYHAWTGDTSLYGIVNQQIYKERYIGYKGGPDGATFLITKAQTKDQKAVLSK